LIKKYPMLLLFTHMYRNSVNPQVFVVYKD